jgi:hypothetical protein
MSLPAELQFLL